MHLRLILHLFKNSHRIPTEPMRNQHSSHTYPTGIPIPTAALVFCLKILYVMPLLDIINKPSLYISCVSTHSPIETISALRQLCVRAATWSTSRSEFFPFHTTIQTKRCRPMLFNIASYVRTTAFIPVHCIRLGFTASTDRPYIIACHGKR